MGFKASNQIARAGMIFSVMTLFAFAAKASTLDADIADALQKKDWPAIVLLLQPHKGQNFEHDLTLAKALLSLERRQEAQKLLVALQDERKDERVSHLIQSAGALFFAQETSTLYYESLDLIRTLKFPEAKDHLEQALAKEPGQALVLSRLIQMQLVLGQDEAATASLLIAQSTGLNPPEFKLYAAKIAVDNVDKKPTEDENEDELYHELVTLKTQLLENEVTLSYWAEALKRAQKENELEVLAEKTLKDHPLWTQALLWFYPNPLIAPATKQKIRTQLDKNLKNKAAFIAALESEMKNSDYFWVGYVSYETLLEQLKLVTPTPTAAPSESPKNQ